MKTFRNLLSSFRLMTAASLLVCGSALADGPISANEPIQIKGHEEGQQLYMNYCASCHGRDLQGANAQSLVDGVWQFGDGPHFVRRNIKFGIVSAGMPEYGSTLSDKQIRQIVDFMDAAGTSLGVERPPLPEVLQTRDYAVNATAWIPESQGLSMPWGMVFLNADTALITERTGQLRLVQQGRLHPDPIAGTPETLQMGQGGLLDVAIDPNYEHNGYIYLSYSHQQPDGPKNMGMTRLVRGKIKDHQWVDEALVFEAPYDTYRKSGAHFGSRIVFTPDGMLYFSIGDRGAMNHAQDLSRPNGKIHRVHPDGSIPADNPFVDTPDALPSIYSYGHRNPQGLAVHPATGAVWDAEHGPLGGDELNLVAKAKNYGWPVISYGVNYNGSILTEEYAKEGMEQPVMYWTPSIAVCGIDFYGQGPFARWENNLLVTGLSHEKLSRLVIVDDRVLHEEVILQGQGRVRDVCVGPDGAIYVLHNQPDRIVKLTMRERVVNN